MVELLDDEQLTVLVSFILEDLFDGYLFTSFRNCGLEF
jgi:hypothetical protein